MEVIVAASMLSVLFLTTIPLLGHLRTVRREADRQMVAQQEAANVMEAVALLASRDQLAREQLDTITLSPAAARLPDHKLVIALEVADDPLPGRRVLVRVTWQREDGGTAPPAELTAWFPDRGDQ